MPRPLPLRAVLLCLVLLCPAAAGAQSPADASASAEAVVRSFHDALRSGNVALVEQLLAADAVVIEGGRIESRDEYLAHHLPADIEFAKAVPSRRIDVRSTRQGATAWVRSASTAKGMFHDRPIDLAGAELIVLSRSGPSWKIRAIHWSSYQPH